MDVVQFKSGVQFNEQFESLEELGRWVCTLACLVCHVYVYKLLGEDSVRFTNVRTARRKSFAPANGCLSAAITRQLKKTWREKPPSLAT